MRRFSVFFSSASVFLASPCHAQSATIEPVGEVCPDRCPDRHAVFFIHGIYGNGQTFTNGSFDWPKALPREVEWQRSGEGPIRKASIDVYRIDYQTALFAWARKDIASLDEVTDALFEQLYGRSLSGLIPRRDYLSVGFIAHSLGGNVAASYLHTVKSEIGHGERARHSFLITLGTPVGGSQIANIGSVLKTLVGMQDPLLESLKKDNTFLRMLQKWRRSEDIKAMRLSCRHVGLFIAIEGKPTNGFVEVVSSESARATVKDFASEVRVFDTYDHSRIAKPSGTDDPLYQWVNGVIQKGVSTAENWDGRTRCKPVGNGYLGPIGRPH